MQRRSFRHGGRRAVEMLPLASVETGVKGRVFIARSRRGCRRSGSGHPTNRSRRTGPRCPTRRASRNDSRLPDPQAGTLSNRSETKFSFSSGFTRAGIVSGRPRHVTRVSASLDLPRQPVSFFVGRQTDNQRYHKPQRDSSKLIETIRSSQKLNRIVKVPKIPPYSRMLNWPPFAPLSGKFGCREFGLIRSKRIRGDLASQERNVGAGCLTAEVCRSGAAQKCHPRGIISYAKNNPLH